MKSLKLLSLLLLVVISAQFAFAQEINKLMNLFAGEIQSNGLPAGWITAVDNFDCTIKFDENKAIYFERQTKNEKCSFAFTKEVSNGIYLLKTNFKIDGNGKGIMLDGVPLRRQHEIKVTDGKIRIGIQTKGGKAWGWIRNMTLTKK